MSLRHLLLSLIPVLALGLAAPQVEAQSLVEKRPRGDRQAERPRVSLDQAVNMAENRYDAKAVRAQQSVSGDRLVYNIRLLSSDGKVRNVQVDAQTGQMY